MQYKMGYRYSNKATWTYDIFADNLNDIFRRLTSRIKWHDEVCPGMYVFEVFEKENDK